MNKLRLPKGRKRNTVTLLLVLSLAAVLLALNLLFPFALRRGGVYPDLTPEGLYTLTDAMKREIGALDTDVEILFLSAEDKLLEHSLLRYVYIMSKKLTKENEHVTVRTVDLATDPTAADDFKTAKGSALRSTDVIIHSGGRYKILGAEAFFTLDDNGEKYASYNGEYRMATAILSVTTFAEGPYAYFAVGHGERYYVEGDAGSDPSLSAFAGLLADAGLRVGKLSLDEVDEVPDDCVLLIFCGTKTDYTAGDIYDYESASALKKLDKYLYERNSVMLFRDALDAPLPNLEDYLAEWGIAFTPTHLTSPEDSLVDSVTGEKNGDRLVAAYPDRDYDAPGYALIKDVAALATPPKTVFANAMALKNTFGENTSVHITQNVSRAICPVFFASDAAKAHNAAGEIAFKPQGDAHILALIAVETAVKPDENEYYSYVFAAGSTAMISNDYLADSAFGNADVMASVLRTLSRTDVYASSDIGSSDMNSPVYGGKWFEDKQLATTSQTGTNTVWYNQDEYAEFSLLTGKRAVGVTISVFLVPLLVIPFLGVAVLRRRKNR